MSLKKVLDPIQIAGCTVPNRVVRTAHATNIGRGRMSDKLIAYHAARAKGGVGLSILEILSVHPTSPSTLNMFDNTLDEGYGRLMDAVRPHGMKIFQQLWHGGHNGVPMDGTPPWAPSATPNALGYDIPIPMTKDMIDEIVGCYASAAERCEKAGIDGVEIHGSHGYLVQQFLSPLTNRREDEYGGSFENRARFALELMRAVNSVTSEGFAVGIRLSPDGVKNGVGAEDNRKLVRLLQAEGLVDFVDISLGSYHVFPKLIGGMHEILGYQMATSAPIAEACDVPTIVCGRIRTLEEADQIIRQGQADMVGMTRAHIADPDIVRKTKAGHPERVRPCISCNQGCVGTFFTKGKMSCTINPAVGLETRLEDNELGPAETSKKVLVVGGGPAGLEAARVAAVRGHEVILAEATGDLAGMIHLASNLPTRHGIVDIATWLQDEVLRLGVDVRLGTYMEAEDVLAEKPDAVIVATGAAPRMDGLQSTNPGEPVVGMDRPHVYSSNELLQKRQPAIGNSAVVLDDTGHYEAIGVAEYLMEAGAAVTFVTTLAGFGPKVEFALMTEPALERLGRGRFDLLIRHRLVEVKEKSVLAAPTYSGTVLEIPAETVVLVTPNLPIRDLYDDLKGKVADLHLIGDANSPRFLPKAFREGRLAGLAV